MTQLSAEDVATIAMIKKLVLDDVIEGLRLEVEEDWQPDIDDSSRSYAIRLYFKDRKISEQSLNT